MKNLPPFVYPEKISYQEENIRKIKSYTYLSTWLRLFLLWEAEYFDKVTLYRKSNLTPCSIVVLSY